MKSFILKVGLALLVIIVALAAYYKTELKQLYHTVRLFHADVIVQNFSQMETLAPSVTIARTEPVIEWGSAPAELPETFLYEGEEVDLNQWLEESSSTALVVIKGNDLVYEDYFQGTGEFDPRISWSMAKSFLSAIFGVAVYDGLIPDLNAPVTDYVPSLIGSGYEGVSIKNVLQMSSGIHFNEDYSDFNSDINRFGRIMALGGSFDDFAGSFSSNREQGTYMHYVSIDTHVIGMVLRAATGKSIVEYFDEKLWSKLGSERDAIYVTDSRGEPMVLGGLNLISRDYARLGKLYRDFGFYNDEQVIPAQWIEDSITPDASHLMPGKRTSSSTSLGYGYQWWIPENADQEFFALGIYGQYIYINRALDVVIVKNSADIGFMDRVPDPDYLAMAAFRAIANSISDKE
ncbi:serine hydrolase domain-containing protein [Reinekea sp.]|uniref:serine hydrolase domain-containing protein n=1 Tax=Reinekea sp. TaxID=1970455 RepID=UPI003988F7DF